MTVKQLTNAGYSEDQQDRWVQLKNPFISILLFNDGYLYPEDDNQFYLDTTNELLYVRYLNPISKQPIRAGFEDSKIGYFHAVWDIDEITCIQ